MAEYLSPEARVARWRAAHAGPPHWADFESEHERIVRANLELAAEIREAERAARDILRGLWSGLIDNPYRIEVYHGGGGWRWRIIGPGGSLLSAYVPTEAEAHERAGDLASSTGFEVFLIDQPVPGDTGQHG